MKQTAYFDNVLNEVQSSMKSCMENIFFLTIMQVNSAYFLILEK